MPRDAIVFFSRVRLTCSAFSSMNSVVPQSARLQVVLCDGLPAVRQQRLEQLALIRRQDDGLIVDKERVGLPVEQEICPLEQIRPPLIALEDVSDARQQRSFR